MTDSISDEDADRVGEIVPPEFTTPGEVAGFLKDREPTNPDGSTWTQSQIEGFGERIADRRESRFSGDPQIKKTVDEKTGLSGPGVTGVKTAMVKDEKGRYVTSAKNLNTYVDNHGNLIGYPQGRGNDPGARRVLERNV